MSPLDLDNLEGTLREVKERNQRLREECEQAQASRRRKGGAGRKVSNNGSIRSGLMHLALGS